MKINADLLLEVHQLRVQLRERTTTPTEAITKLTQLLIDHPHGMDLVPHLHKLNERLIGELDTWLNKLERGDKPSGHRMFGSFDVDAESEYKRELDRY